jgi:hypothetical protein
MSKLGQSIRDAFYSSDSEPELDPESEDEIRGLLDGGYNVVPDKTSWREPV